MITDACLRFLQTGVRDLMASLSYDDQVRGSFRAELAGLLEHSPEVGLEQRTSLTMGQALG